MGGIIGRIGITLKSVLGRISLGIEKFQGEESVELVSQVDIRKWLSNLNDVDFSLPYLHVQEHRIALMIKGRPHSERSKKGSKRVRKIVQDFGPYIKSKIPEPFKGPLTVNIEVFTRSKEDLPDLDRFSIPILDAFKGMVYEDDKQIESLHPRIFETENIFVKLECRTEPMELSTIERMPIGGLLPLCRSIYDFFVVRINN